MKVSQSNGSLLGKFSDEKVIDMMADAGFDAIDFGFFQEKYYNKDATRKHFLYIKEYAESKGVYFNQAHAPFPTSVADDKRTEEIFENVVRSLRNASYLGIKNIVVHPKQHLTYEDEGVPETLFEMNMEFYNKLIPYCEEYNIRVCLENMWQSHNFIGGGSIVDSTCSTPEEFVRYLDALDNKHFGACLDVGHCMLVHQDPAKFIRVLGDRLVALHIHDVDGRADLHTIPYHGGMGKWDTIAKALSDINYKGDFTMEVVYFLEKFPLELYPVATKMIAETGRYIADMIK